MVAIIDYDAGNIKSVEKAVGFLGEEAVVTRDRDVISGSDKVILPGVGSFGDAMNKLNGYGLVNVIYDVCNSGKPFWESASDFSFYIKTVKNVAAFRDLEYWTEKYLRYPTGGLRFRRLAGTAST